MIYEKIKKLFLSVFTCLSLIGLMAPAQVNAASTKRYTIIPLYNYGKYQIATQTIQDSGDSKGRIVMKYGDNLPISDEDIIGPINDLNSINDSLGNTAKSQEGQYLEFPGSASKTVDNTDYEQAKWVANSITLTLNEAVNKVFEYGKDSNGNSIVKNDENFIEIVRQISNASAIGNTVDIYGVSFDFNTSNFSDNAIKDIDRKYLTSGSSKNSNSGASHNQFVKISASGVEDIYLQWSFPKGYSEGQLLHKEGMTYTDNKDIEFITWKGIGWFVCKAYANGIYFGSEKFEKSNDMMDGFYDMVYSFISGVLASLGVENVETLMFNKGRETSYFMGLMPAQWFSIGSLLYWVAQIIAIIILFGSVVKLLLKRNISVISPSERASLKDGVMNIAMTILLLVMFIPVFYILVRTNFLIVETFASMAGGDTISVISYSSGLWGLIISIVTLVILLMLNIQYFVRAVTILVLYICAPIAISSISFSGKGNGLFTHWFKELLVNIFIQSLNAAVLALFIIMGRYSQFSGLEGILMIACFMPLNRYIKNNIAGMQGIGSDGVAKDATQMTAGTVGMGAVALAKGAGHIGESVGNTLKERGKMEYASKHGTKDSGSNSATIQISKATAEQNNTVEGENNKTDKFEIEKGDSLSVKAYKHSKQKQQRKPSVFGTLAKSTLDVAGNVAGTVIGGAVASEMDGGFGHQLQGAITYKTMQGNRSDKDNDEQGGIVINGNNIVVSPNTGGLVHENEFNQDLQVSQNPQLKTLTTKKLNGYEGTFNTNMSKPTYVTPTGKLTTDPNKACKIGKDERCVEFAPMTKSAAEQFKDSETGQYDLQALQHEYGAASLVTDIHGNYQVGMLYYQDRAEKGSSEPTINVIDNKSTNEYFSDNIKSYNEEIQKEQNDLKLNEDQSTAHSIQDGESIVNPFEKSISTDLSFNENMKKPIANPFEEVKATNLYFGKGAKGNSSSVSMNSGNKNKRG